MILAKTVGSDSKEKESIPWLGANSQVGDDANRRGHGVYSLLARRTWARRFSERSSFSSGV